MSYNKLVIVGNLGRDPEMQYMPNQQAVTNLSVAVTNKWTDSAGAHQEQTIWYRVSAFGSLAESCNTFLKKGRQVLVEGRLAPDPETGGPRIFKRKDGTFGASYEVRATTIEFLGGKQDWSDEETTTVEKEDIPF